MRAGIQDWEDWEEQFTAFIAQGSAEDPAHDLGHILRVVANAKALAASEGARLDVVVPAAWLHDCVSVPKDSVERHQASRRAAAEATDFLRRSGYPPEEIEDIAHAIRAHSFTAQIAPETLEAKVVQDADRLDAIGAIGIARCFAVAGVLGLPLYQLDEPFPEARSADDKQYAVDHFYTKLLGLAREMNTEAGRVEAERRTQIMRQFLAELGVEIAGSL